MSRRLITLLLVSGTLLQTMLPMWGIFDSLELPVITGLLIFIALHTDRSEVVYAAVLAGLLRDAFSPAPLGLSIPFFVLLSFGINWIRDEVFGDQLTTYAVLGTAAAIAETLYYALVFKLSGLRPVFIGSLAMRLVGGLLAGATIVPLTALAALQFRRITARGRRHAI
jgi:rod shape-determining protein MreD